MFCNDSLKVEVFYIFFDYEYTFIFLCPGVFKKRMKYSLFLAIILYGR